MNVICKNCGAVYDDLSGACPACGTPAEGNSHPFPEDGIPRTIEEMRIWYEAMKLPPEEVTRFFIGRDIREPKAFGICESGGRYCVYKNKADGSRAVRYDGPDEAYAVKELYLRLKQEIAQQKLGNYRTREQKRKDKRKLIITLAVIAAFAVGFVLINFFTPNRGYYYYGDTYYYYQSGWYYYDYDDGWCETQAPQGLRDGYGDYYVSDSWDKGMNAGDFALSEYYRENDSDSGWSDSDSWDSDSTDWSSDW